LFYASPPPGIFLHPPLHFSAFLFIINYVKMVSKREKVAASIIIIGFLNKNQKKPRTVWERK